MIQNQNWRPIETVPQEIKDSREDILLARIDETYGPLYGIGWWNVINGYGYWKTSIHGNPTHWMPIIPLTTKQ